MELDQADLKAAAAFSTAAYNSGVTVWSALNSLGQSTGAGGWIVNGSPEWIATYGAALGGTYDSVGAMQIHPGTNENGFFLNDNASAIAAVKDGQLILAFRGSDSMRDIEDAAFDPIAHYDRLRLFIDDVARFVRDPSHGISEVVITGHSLGGEMAQLFASSYVDEGVTHSADVNSLGLAPANVSIIPFAHAGLPNDPGANFVVSSTWLPRITNILSSKDVVYTGSLEFLSGHVRAGQDLVIDLNTVPVTLEMPAPNVQPFISMFVSPIGMDSVQHHPLNYSVAMDVIASSSGFDWINSDNITLFGIGDDQDNSSVTASGGNPNKLASYWGSPATTACQAPTAMTFWMGERERIRSGALAATTFSLVPPASIRPFFPVRDPHIRSTEAQRR